MRRRLNVVSLFLTIFGNWLQAAYNDHLSNIFNILFFNEGKFTWVFFWSVAKRIERTPVKSHGDHFC